MGFFFMTDAKTPEQCDKINIDLQNYMSFSINATISTLYRHHADHVNQSNLPRLWSKKGELDNLKK